jgi:hypothetical protein
VKGNLDQALAELARTNVVYLVDSQTGEITPHSLDAYIDDKGKIPSRFHVRATSTHAQATRAKILSKS